jgi:hypothetical protein
LYPPSLRLALLALAFAVAGMGQTTPPAAVLLAEHAVITEYAGGTVKGVTIGTSTCNLWLNSPAVGQYQAACYESGVIAFNVIETLPLGDDTVSSSYPHGQAAGWTLFWTGTQMSWILWGMGADDFVAVVASGTV